MKIERDAMLKTLEVAQMAIAGSDHLEQLGHFIFEGDYLITFNNRLLIYYPLKTDFKCSVNSELLYKQLQKFETSEIDVSLVHNRLKIKGKRESAKLAVTTDKDSELFNVISTIREEQLSDKYEEIPEDFAQAIDMCSLTASKNAADGTLCCVCVSGKEVMSTDNYRVTKFILSQSMSSEDILLDARIANELKRFKMSSFLIGKNWLHFMNKEDVILSARRIFGDYMDISSAFEFEGASMKLPPNTEVVLDFLGVILNKKQQVDRVADITIKDGLFTAHLEDPKATLSKSIELHEKYKDLDIAFRVNVDFLMSVLKHTKSMVYNLETGRAMFQSRDKSFQHCIRLMPEVRTVEEAVKAANEEEDIKF